MRLVDKTLVNLRAFLAQSLYEERRLELELRGEAAGEYDNSKNLKKQPDKQDDLTL